MRWMLNKSRTALSAWLGCCPAKYSRERRKRCGSTVMGSRTFKASDFDGT